MYEDDSIDDLFLALERRIVELIQAKESAEVARYEQAQERLRDWQNAGQPGELPAEVRALPDDLWQGILRQRPLPDPTPIPQTWQATPFDPPSVDLSPLVEALERIEERQLAEKAPPLVDFSQERETLARMETHLLAQTSPQPISPWPFLVALLFVAILLSILLLWRTEDLLTAQNGVKQAMGRQIDQLQASIQGLVDASQQTSGAATAEAALYTRIAEAETTATALAQRVAQAQSDLLLAGTAQATLQAENLTREANLWAKEAEVEATAQSIHSMATDVAQKESQQSTQAIVSVERARATATALIQSAGATVTAIAGIVPTRNGTIVPTATPIPVNTPTGVTTPTTPTPLPAPIPLVLDGRFAITFPTEGAQLYVAPWQVEVSAKEWFAAATRYRLLLDGAVLTTFTLAANAPLTQIVYTRAFEEQALFDSFPMESAERRILGPDANGQLVVGTYTLQLQIEVQGRRTILAERKFDIRSDAPPQASLAISTNLRRHLGPNQGALTDSASGLSGNDRQPVRLLGKTRGFDQDPTIAAARNEPVEWVLWETTDDTPRRGWAPARFFIFQDAKTIDDVPIIAPPQPD